MNQRVARAMRAANRHYADGGDVQDNRNMFSRAADATMDYAGRGLALGDLYTGGVLSSLAGLNPFGSYSDVMAAREKALAGVPREAKALATEPINPVAAIFAGPMARTANKVMLRRAEELASQNAPREQIWNETGWFQGPDKKWRFEIDDSNLKLAQPVKDWIDRRPDGTLNAPNVEAAYEAARNNLAPNAPMRMKRMFEHDELERAYPGGMTQASDHNHQGATSIPLHLLDDPSTAGAYIPEGYHGRSIALHGSLTPDRAKSTALHEWQHAVQHYEDLARGGAPGMGQTAPFVYSGPRIESLKAQQADIEKKMEALPYLSPEYEAARKRHYDLERGIEREAAMRGYDMLAGEVEARAVQTRAALNAEQRRACAPWLDYDVPMEQQIVRGWQD